jgi:hypothetical protein
MPFRTTKDKATRQKGIKGETRQSAANSSLPLCLYAFMPLCLLELTNAGKIIFTIFTALKKTNHLFFK